MNLSFFQYVPFVYSLLKSFVLHKKHDYKVDNFNKTNDKIDAMEHMLVKIEKKIRENRVEIEELRKQVMLSRVINLIMGILIVVLVIFK